MQKKSSIRLHKNAVYLLKNGEMLRCHGLWRLVGPDYRFLKLSEKSMGSTCPTGRRISERDILRRVTAMDAGLIQRRLEVYEARGLYDLANDMRSLMKEFGLSGK